MKDKKLFFRNIPNIISGFRIVLVGIFAYYFSQKKYLHCLIIYATAFFSDVLDGYLARRNNWITPLGKLLDPFADKLMLITALICFAINDWIPLWVVIAIVIKELSLCIFGGILLMKKVVVEADITGKIATGLWTVGVVLTILVNFIPKLSLISGIVLTCSVAASFLALVNYAARYLISPRTTNQDEKVKVD